MEMQSVPQQPFLVVSNQNEKQSPAGKTEDLAAGPRRRGFKPKTWEEFLSHMDSRIDRRGPDDCWPFKGGLTNGYGCMYFERKLLKVGRVMWERANGRKMLYKMEACHKCDNPACCNPNHIFEGTHLQNMRDMQRKGRDNKSRGTNQPAHKLNDEQVREIRSRYAKGDISLRELAIEYKVCKSTIRYAVHGYKWSHVK